MRSGVNPACCVSREGAGTVAPQLPLASAFVLGWEFVSAGSSWREHPCSFSMVENILPVHLLLEEL